jgi:hypothetical protein
MTIEDLIESFGRSPDCRVFPPSGLPVVAKPSHVLPVDLVRFYEICGGVELFWQSDFGFRISGPSEFVSSNPVLLGEYYLRHKTEIDRDKSSNWYIAARGILSPQEVVTIDLGDRLGYCYDSFWDVYATGNSQIVALSFTDLLERLFEAKGQELHWESPIFDMGFAY